MQKAAYVECALETDHSVLAGYYLILVNKNIHLLHHVMDVILHHMTALMPKLGTCSPTM